MALPSSGLIRLSDIQTEFGGSNPVSLSEYYRGGSYVPISATTTTIPSSGQISVSNFYATVNVPAFSATARWSGTVTAGSTLDASSFVTTPYSTLLVIQHFTAEGEPFYYPPTPKLNGVDMPLVKSQYSNALDDGRAFTLSTKSVAAGNAATITWTVNGSANGGTGYGIVFEVLGFRDMYAALHDVQVSTNLTSSNVPAPTSVSVSTPGNGKVVYLTHPASVGVDVSGVMDQADYYFGNEFGFDINPPAGGVTYTCANRLTVVAVFDADLA